MRERERDKIIIVIIIVTVIIVNVHVHACIEFKRGNSRYRERTIVQNNIIKILARFATIILVLSKIMKHQKNYIN